MNNLVLKIEDESSDNDNSKASKTIDNANDDVGNIFYLKTTKKYILTLMNILLVLFICVYIESCFHSIPTLFLYLLLFAKLFIRKRFSLTPRLVYNYFV